MAKDILQEIVAHKRVEVEAAKQAVAPSVLYKQVEAILDFSVASMKSALTA
jgi:indole-3-glycerol phosphate synthase